MIYEFIWCSHLIHPHERQHKHQKSCGQCNCNSNRCHCNLRLRWDALSTCTGGKTAYRLNQIYSMLDAIKYDRYHGVSKAIIQLCRVFSRNNPNNSNQKKIDFYYHHDQFTIQTRMLTKLPVNY